MTLRTSVLKITYPMSVSQCLKSIPWLIQPVKVPPISQLQMEMTCYQFVLLESEFSILYRQLSRYHFGRHVTLKCNPSKKSSVLAKWTGRKKCWLLFQQNVVRRGWLMWSSNHFFLSWIKQIKHNPIHRTSISHTPPLPMLLFFFPKISGWVHNSMHTAL